MSADTIINPKEATPQALKDLLDTALFETELDKDGDLVVHDSCYVIVTPVNEDYIRLLTMYRFKEDSSVQAREALCCRVNDGLIVVRANAHGQTLEVDWYLPLRGGIVKKAFVLALKQFIGLVAAVGKYDTDGIVA